jgi:hypothetical protein
VPGDWLLLHPLPQSQRGLDGARGVVSDWQLPVKQQVETGIQSRLQMALVVRDDLPSRRPELLQQTITVFWIEHDGLIDR